jgi:hypothetical protein
LFDKDYVILKLLQGRDQHSSEVMKQLNQRDFGIPWMAITDADGTILATSDGPLGNIGHPTTVEAIRHVRDMLKRTASRLSDDELDRLVQPLAQPME